MRFCCWRDYSAAQVGVAFWGAFLPMRLCCLRIWNLRYISLTVLSIVSLSVYVFVSMSLSAFVCALRNNVGLDRRRSNRSFLFGLRRSRTANMFFGGFPGMPGGDFQGGGRGGGRSKNVDTNKFYELLEVDKNANEVLDVIENTQIRHTRSCSSS